MTTSFTEHAFLYLRKIENVIKIFRNNNHLKLLQIWSSGYDKFNLKDASANKIRVANNGGANAISVAEHTIMMILAISRKISEMSYRLVDVISLPCRCL